MSILYYFFFFSSAQLKRLLNKTIEKINNFLKKKIETFLVNIYDNNYNKLEILQKYLIQSLSFINLSLLINLLINNTPGMINNTTGMINNTTGITPNSFFENLDKENINTLFIHESTTNNSINNNNNNITIPEYNLIINNNNTINNSNKTKK